MEIYEILATNEILLRSFKNIDLKQICKSRSYAACFGVDKDAYNTLVFVRNAKSRFVKKDAQFLLELGDKISQSLGKVVKKRILFYNSEICSKSVKILKENGFKIYDFV